MLICDNERRAVVRLRFQHRFNHLRIVRAHRDLRDVDIPVGHRDISEILLRDVFPLGGEFRDRPGRGRF